MLHKLSTIGQLIGNTPLLKLEHEQIELYCKMESSNYTGSVKVRPAYYILSEAIRRGEITEHTTVIESTSGNFGCALAVLCKRMGIRFIPVIDPNVNPAYEKFLRAVSHDVVKVTERDETGGYLLTRIKMVQQLLQETEDAFWTNQYGNRDNFKAHYYGLGTEIADHFDKLDYAFIGVSSGGTISGVSRKLKEKFPQIKIVAVDSEGSVIFGGAPQKRYIPGIGSSMVPDVLQEALIDDVIQLSEEKSVEGCYNLLNYHGIFAGGSSGTSYYAIQEYFRGKVFQEPPKVVFLCPDGGNAYVDTLYDAEWVAWFREQKNKHSVLS